MKKLFTLFALLMVFLGANAKTFVDAEVDFSKYTDISQVPRFSWGGSQQAWDRLSIVDGCLHWSSTEVPLNDDGEPTAWMAQWFPIGGVDAEVGVTYTLHYKIKGDHADNISALGFGQTPYGAFAITTDWVEGTVDYECTEANGNILMQAGGYVGTFDIAYLKITHEGKEERPVEWIELLTNGDAEKSWADCGLDPNTKYNDTENNYKICFWSKEKGHNLNEDGGWDPFPAEIIQEADGNHAFICRAQLADTDGDAAAWDNQIWIESPRSWKAGEQFKLSFRYKASQTVVTNTQLHKQNPSDYLHWVGVGDVEFTTDWQTFETVFSVPSDGNGMWSVAFNLNPNVKDPTDFYIDDISLMQMKLDEGLFVAAANTESGLIEYDFDNATEFVYDEEQAAMKATVGTAGNKETWVNEVMISTVRGNDRQYKANTLKLKGAAEEGLDVWTDYESGSGAKIKLPAQGVWNIYVDTEAFVMAFEKVEGDEARQPLNPEDCINETEVIVNAVERPYTLDEAKAAGLIADNDNPTDEEKALYNGQPWDNQFFLIGNRALEVGEEVYIKFDYKSETPAQVGTQNSKDAGGYLHWAGLGNLDFNADWQTFEATVAIPSETKGSQNSWTFNLAGMKGANKYYFKNFIFMTADKLENLIDKEGTKNLMVKEGQNTAAYEYGNKPEDPDAIKNVVNGKATTNAAYNLAGQRVSKEYKGIAIQNGRKFTVK